MPVKSTCPVCGSSHTSVFFEILDMPGLIGILWPSREGALNCPKGDITLSFCTTCGFITNLAFDPSQLHYTQAYDNSLHFSPMYNNYAHSVALRLIERYGLYNKTIIEIGCGKGDFLLQLCKLGNNHGVGFDPSYESREINGEIARRITFIQDMYSTRYASYQGDLICSRYVFEHIENPVKFLNMIRHNIGDRSHTVVYFEVPSVYLILHSLSIWDIIYEHCSYFSPGSLAYVFESCGFDILELAEIYGNQFISIDASPEGIRNVSQFDHQNDLKKITRDVEAFVPNYRAKMHTWQDHLRRIEKASTRAVAWGAGAKGVSFLNMLKIQDQIGYVVDINPHKHGKYIAGTGQKIVPPEFLKEYNPDIIIIMNQIYKDEIRQTIHDMGITAELVCA